VACRRGRRRSTSPPPSLLLEGFGFSAGFFFVVLAEAVLFSEANVVLPTTLHLAHGGEPGWPTALGWNIVPAGIGNMLGAAVLVAVPFWYVHHPAVRKGVHEPSARS
jgi:formate/nitrite transporter FocA (FNT family)